MDIKIKDSDICVAPCGEYVLAEGIDEVLQRVLINVQIKKGSFIYNKKLGTDLTSLDPDDPNVLKNAEVLLREAVMNSVDAKINVLSFMPMENGNLKLRFSVEDTAEIKETEVILVADL